MTFPRSRLPRRPPPTLPPVSEPQPAPPPLPSRRERYRRQREAARRRLTLMAAAAFLIGLSGSALWSLFGPRCGGTGCIAALGRMVAAVLPAGGLGGSGADRTGSPGLTAGTEPARGDSRPAAPPGAPAAGSILIAGEFRPAGGGFGGAGGGGLDPLAPRLRAAQVAVVVLGAPLTAGGVRELAAAGVDAVSLAAPGAWPRPGAPDPAPELPPGLTAFGMPTDPRAVPSPLVRTVAGTRVALVGLTDAPWPAPDPVPPGSPAGPETPPPAPVPPPDPPAVARAALAAARGQSDLVIAVVHWAERGAGGPTGRQVEFARLLVAAGADLVVGTGPPEWQGLERVQGRPVIYNLGPLSGSGSTGRTLEVLVAGGRLRALKLHPHRLDGAGRPVPAPDLWAGRPWARVAGTELQLLRGAPERHSGDLMELHYLTVPPTCPPGDYRVTGVEGNALALGREGYRGSQYWVTPLDDPAGCLRLPDTALAALAAVLPPDSLLRVEPR